MLSANELFSMFLGALKTTLAFLCEIPFHGQITVWQTILMGIWTQVIMLGQRFLSTESSPQLLI